MYQATISVSNHFISCTLSTRANLVRIVQEMKWFLPGIEPGPYLSSTHSANLWATEVIKFKKDIKLFVSKHLSLLSRVL